MTETAKNTATSLQRFSPYAVDGGCDAYGQMEEDDHGDYYNREDCDAALAAALVRETALQTALVDAAELAHGVSFSDKPIMAAWGHRVEVKIRAALEAKP